MLVKINFKKTLGIFICSFVFFTIAFVNVCEASMYRTMTWAGAGVTITNSTDTSGYTNKCKLNTYSKSDQQGLTLDIKASYKTVDPAMVYSSNKSNKSAYAEHYTYDGNMVVQKKIYYRNKGDGYSYY